MDLKQLQDKTKDLQKSFPVQFDKRDVMLDLVEEVGELAQALLMVEGRKHTSDPIKQRSVRDIANGISDILFDLMMLASKYDLDIGVEYLKVLNEIESRIKAGEFDNTEALKG
jgi:NTP pyrophosphatase (non-canonical NTP hydrolase)